MPEKSFLTHQIKLLHLENFKSFGERAIIPMAPITLILGENSAGKSSILQALHLLRQTQEKGNIHDLLTPFVENGIVDLGSIPELLFDHDVNRKLKVRVDVGFLSDPVGAWVASQIHESRRRFPHTIEETRGVEFHFEYSGDARTVSLRCIEMFSSKIGLLARFQRFKDISDPEILDEYKLLDFNLSFTGYDRDVAYFNKNISMSEVSFLHNTFITDSPEYWRDSFNFVKSEQQRILQSLKTKLDQLTENQEVGSRDQQGMGHIGSVRRVSLGYPEDDFDDGFARREELARELLMNGLNKALEFYSNDFSLDDFIFRMQTEQRRDTLAMLGMLELKFSGGFPGRFEERSIEKNIPTSESILKIADQIVELNECFKSELDKILPLGPHREPPSRWYALTEKKPQDVGLSGGSLPDLLFQNPKLVDTTNDWLKRLGIDYQLQIVKLDARYRDLYEIRFVDERRKDSIDVSLKDLGFGISQILPVVVQSLAGYKKILTIQQPELHIHPRLQANLGDLFAESIDNRQNQFIIETHSEHLVLRLQRLIRTGKIKADDVSILYVSRDSSGSSVQRLRLDDCGEFIDDWPGGFFPERLEELL